MKNRMETESGYEQYVDVFYGSGAVKLPKPEGIAATWFFLNGQCGNTYPHASLPFGKMSCGLYTGGYPTGYGNHMVNYGGCTETFTGKSDDVYDVALIEKYVFYYVSAVDESAEKIYDMYGKETIDLSRFKEEKVSLISNDNAVECSSISPVVILRVVCSFDAYGKIDYNRTFAAEILTQSVTGKISGKTDDNEFEIGGDYYYVLPEIAAELKLGDNTTFMLGMDNLIVAYLDFNQTDALEYSYLVL